MDDSRTVVQNATNEVTRITPSVIALAIALGVAPKKFADAMFDEEKKTDFLVELTGAYAKNAAAKAKKSKTA